MTIHIDVCADQQICPICATFADKAPFQLHQECSFVCVVLLQDCNKFVDTWMRNDNPSRETAVICLAPVVSTRS